LVPRRGSPNVILNAVKNPGPRVAHRLIPFSNASIAPKVRRTGVCAAKCVATSNPLTNHEEPTEPMMRNLHTTQKYSAPLIPLAPHDWPRLPI
jgi:hypothetical protein